MSPLKKHIHGMSWYTETEWEKVKNISVDKDDFAGSYQDWLTSAERTKSFFEKEGYLVDQVLISAEELKNWSQQKNCKIHESSRSRFVSEKMKSNS